MTDSKGLFAFAKLLFWPQANCSRFLTIQGVCDAFEYVDSLLLGAHELRVISHYTVIRWAITILEIFIRLLEGQTDFA